MKIRDFLKRESPCFSFEFFPPKEEAGFQSLFETVKLLKQLDPTFVSVTYGAGGSTRRKTIDLVTRIKHSLGVESMAHLTCVAASRQEVQQVLEELVANRMENVLALRGDPPKGQAAFLPDPRYANELVHFIRSHYDLCIGVASYPEKHPECASLEQDLINLKRKVDAGADFLITQLFFDNRDFFSFVERARKAGINLPIIPGIMPILSVPQIKRFTEMCGAKIPGELLQRIESVQNDPAEVERCGVEYATVQCHELLEERAPGIHFYTLNRSKATWEIFKNLKS
ncbi:MAG: methylenetetrahydrofolate reductase [NAD(P)H] [Acidobacteria bacterium]|nr:MAG: methylenetetrahydrofolate reductase [NAD(P)H] [Acidobacteriota bacterium]